MNRREAFKQFVGGSAGLAAATANRFRARDEVVGFTVRPDGWE